MRRLISNWLPSTGGVALSLALILPLVLLVLTLLAQPAKANDIYGSDDWAYTYRDGFHWYNSVPYEKAQFTGYQTKKYYSYGRCYYKKVPYTYWKYRRAATYTQYKEPQSFERLIDKLADMKREVIRGESEMRQYRAYRLEAAQAVKDFNLYGYDLPTDMQEFSYPQEDYQYGPETGATNYGVGVREYVGLSYGGTLQQLDADRVLQDSYEYEKLSQENSSRRKEVLDQSARDIDISRTAAIGDVQKIQAAGDAFDHMMSRIERMLQRVEVYEREQFPVPLDGTSREAVPLPQYGDAQAVFMSKCSECHIDQKKGKLSLADAESLSEKQRKAVYMRITGKGGNPMPPADHPQLTAQERDAIKDWFMASIR